MDISGTIGLWKRRRQTVDEGNKKKRRGKGSRGNGNVARMVDEDLLRNTMIGSQLEWMWLGRRETILLLLSAVRERGEEKTDDCLVIRMNVTSWKQSAGCLFSQRFTVGRNAGF